MIQGDLATPGVRAVVGDVVDIPLDCLAIGPWHVRAHEGDDLTDLAASLASPTGQIEPIIVRSLDSSPVPGQFQVVAGSRRVRAARLAGLDSIRAVIRNVTDAEAAAICYEENARRRDLSALEEAAAVARVVAAAGSAAAAAQALGRDASWVALRASVYDHLEDAWRDAASGAAPPDVRSWTLSHLAVIARLSPEDQEEIRRIYLIRSPHITVRQLQAVIDRTVERRVERAPWADDFRGGLAGAPTCADCGQRSHRSLLFEEMSTGGDRCLVPQCWVARQEAWGRAELEKLRDVEGAEVVLVDPTSPEWARDMPSAHLVASTLLGSALLGGIARVGEAGAVRAAVVEPSGRVREEWVRRPEKAEEATAERLSREDRLRARRRKRLCSLLSAEIARLSHPPLHMPLSVLADIAALVGTATRLDSPQLVAGSSLGIEGPGFAELVSPWDGLTDNIRIVEARLWHAIRPVLLARLSWERWGDSSADLRDECTAVAKLLRIDLQPLLRRVEEEVPLPASWPARAEGSFYW